MQVDAVYVTDDGPQTYKLLETLRVNGLQGPIYLVRYGGTLEEFTLHHLQGNLSPKERLTNIADYILGMAMHMNKM